jgi:hypothetical protein
MKVTIAIELQQRKKIVTIHLVESATRIMLGKRLNEYVRATK